MKNSMVRQNFRNQVNRVRRNATNYANSMRVYTPVSMLIAILNFGSGVMSFFKDLVTTSAGPFAGLNRGQLRRMSWLFCLYPC